jgi:N-acetylglucosaminyldiphosphoundecaprenol N-acetyl-beta-D-mannosaminyltransferase
MLNKKNILGVDITDATKKEILEYIVKNLENFKEKLFLVTPNPEFLVLANKNIVFKNILSRADLALADGVGLMIAAKIMGKPLKERFAGVDLVKSLCEAVAEKPITVGFLGGEEGIAEKTAECLRKKYPKLKVGFVGEEWSKDVNTRQARVSDDAPLSDRGPVKSDPSRQGSFSVHAVGSPSSFATPNDQRAIDILFVAFGAPKQEFWINENLEKIPVKVAIGVGGAFDYISGKIPRAPGFIRNIGLEWLFRLVVQPWRIKRQLSLLEFIWLVAKEKLRKK